jgi:processive 1,2-diacylglycerol beta-glucosyltransferase
MAAHAIMQALRARHPGVVAEHIDAVAEMWTSYKHVYRWAYVRVVDRYPALWRSIYNSTNERSTALGHALTVLASGPFLKRVQDWRPDVVLCTHFLAPELLSRAMRRGALQCDLQAVVTDHDAHRIWYYPEVSRYFVGSEIVKARFALGYGVEEEAITVSGIPVREPFSRPVDPLPTRLSYALDPKRPTVLFLSGGFAAGPMARSMIGLWRDRRDVQIIAVCGRNERLRRRIARLPRPAGATLHALGFVDEVRELMEVADIVIAKSGGITTSECMAAGKPMVISAAIAGQEERNADAVVEAGAGFWAPTPEEVRWRVSRLLADPDLLRQTGQRAAAFGRPQAAADVADAVVASLPRQDGASTGPRFHGAR